ncbi:Unknown protein, partial [Striga hermonthica]
RGSIHPKPGQDAYTALLAPSVGLLVRKVVFEAQLWQTEFPEPTCSRRSMTLRRRPDRLGKALLRVSLALRRRRLLPHPSFKVWEHRRRFPEEMQAPVLPRRLAQQQRRRCHRRRPKTQWWRNLMRPGEKEGCTWERLKELIREKYYPTYYRAEMEHQFLSLKQGTRSVDEYEREFTKLAAF